MGQLTNAMAQLRSDINGSRQDRLSEQNARIADVNAQLADFTVTRLSNGVRDAADRATFIRDNSNDVNRLLNHFNKDRQLMSRQTSQERAAFVNNVAQDRAGAHAAFFGTATDKKKTFLI